MLEQFIKAPLETKKIKGKPKHQPLSLPDSNKTCTRKPSATILYEVSHRQSTRF